MRKILLGLVATAAIATPLVAVTAGSANAATTDAAGVVTVTKGDIQKAMGWNNPAWETNTDTPAEVTALAAKITTRGVANPVDVPGGWLTLNGQIVANYPSDEYYGESWTDPLNWGPNSTPVSSYWTNDANTATVTPIVNPQQKLTGFTVSAAPDTDGFVYYTRHTTYTNPDYDGAEFVYHATSRWPADVAGSGVSDVKVDGKAVTVTPYVAV